MISKLAVEIYDRMILLKKYDRRRLMFRINRRKLSAELIALRKLTGTLSACLRENGCSADQIEPADFMDNSIFRCLDLLEAKGAASRENLLKHIRGIHNLPRAFLPPENPMRISSSEAAEYFRQYTESDGSS